jgi:hypothetical protein
MYLKVRRAMRLEYQRLECGHDRMTPGKKNNKNQNKKTRLSNKKSHAMEERMQAFKSE